MSNQISRREMLKTGTLFAAASSIGFGGMFGFRTIARAEAAGDTVKQIVDVAATAETFACTHYYRALTSNTIRFSAAERTYFLAALDSEFQHLKFLEANGAQALASKFYFPVVTFKDVPTLSKITEVAETVFVGAYVAATRRFAELGNPQLAATAAQVAVVEGQHLLFVRELAGEKVANNVALAAPLFYNVSEAVPVVQPLLDGKKPAGGPLAVDFETSAFAYPGDDKIQATIGKSLLDTKVLGMFDVKPFTAIQGPAMAATMAATMAK